MITNLKFQHASQNIIFQKSSYKKRPSKGPNPLSYYNSIMNLNTISFALVRQGQSKPTSVSKSRATKSKTGSFQTPDETFLKNVEAIGN
jgi:hypothetical protein